MSEGSKFGDRTITETFDEVGEGLYVTIKAPSMLSPKQLSPNRDLGKIKDPNKVERLTNEWLASFITEWHMIDVTDENWDDPAFLGPADADTLGRCPAAVTSWIVREIRNVTDPQ